ncbi:MAG: hypothetical protein WAV41_01985 [Microgenomates group bacterium]
MQPRTQKVLLFIIKIIKNKSAFFFWLFIRFISAFLPLITIFQFSQVVKSLEQKNSLETVFVSIFWLFIIRILDNYLRLISIARLDHAISDIAFDIHNYLLADFKSESKIERHQSIQAVRNFTDASTMTLSLIRQPGIDSLVSLIFIPVALFFLDIRVFILALAYNLIYLFIDHYTTQHYAYLKDILNTKTENYYAKLQESNDYDLEQSSYSRHFNRLSRWGFVEWFTLQNTAVIFYTLILLFLIPEVIAGQRDLSGVVLIMGYVAQTQVLLNSISSIKDSLTDMLVGLEHLAKNQSVAAINFDDLV